jgi:hypothetical protein
MRPFSEKRRASEPVAGEKREVPDAPRKPSPMTSGYSERERVSPLHGSLIAPAFPITRKMQRVENRDSCLGRECLNMAIYRIRFVRIKEACYTFSGGDFHNMNRGKRRSSFRGIPNLRPDD